MVRVSITSRQITSEAIADPPGLSIRRTTALIELSARIFRSAARPPLPPRGTPVQSAPFFLGAGIDHRHHPFHGVAHGQIRMVEHRMKDRGWIDKAFTYWFDEPDPKDYEFVVAGNKRIKAAAPGLAPRRRSI